MYSFDNEVNISLLYMSVVHSSIATDNLISKYLEYNIINFTVGHSNICDCGFSFNADYILNYHNILSQTASILYYKFKHIFKNANVCGNMFLPFSLATLVCTLNECSLINPDTLHNNSKDVVIITDEVNTYNCVKKICDSLEKQQYCIKHIICICYSGSDKILNHCNYPFDYLFQINDIYRFQVNNILSINPFPTYKHILYNHYIFKQKTKKLSSTILSLDNLSFKNIDCIINFVNSVHLYIVGIKINNNILCLSEEDNIKLYELTKSLQIFIWEDCAIINECQRNITQKIKYFDSCRDFISIAPDYNNSVLSKITNKHVKYIISAPNIINSLSTQQLINDALTNVQIIGIFGTICDEPFILPNNNDMMFITRTNINEYSKVPFFKSTLFIFENSLSLQNINDIIKQIQTVNNNSLR